MHRIRRLRDSDWSSWPRGFMEERMFDEFFISKA